MGSYHLIGVNVANFDKIHRMVSKHSKNKLARQLKAVK